jgi:hypothetical protein
MPVKQKKSKGDIQVQNIRSDQLECFEQFERLETRIGFFAFLDLPTVPDEGRKEGYRGREGRKEKGRKEGCKGRREGYQGRNKKRNKGRKEGVKEQRNKEIKE